MFPVDILKPSNVFASTPTPTPTPTSNRTGRAQTGCRPVSLRRRRSPLSARQPGRVDLVALRHHVGARYRIAQLAHVARPAIAARSSESGRREAARRSFLFARGGQ